MTRTELEIANREYNLRLVIIPVFLIILFAYFYYKIFKQMKKLFRSKALWVTLIAVAIIFGFLYLIKPNIFQQKYVTL